MSVGVVELVDSLATKANWVSVCGRVKHDRAVAEDGPVVAEELVEVGDPEAVTEVERLAVEPTGLETQGLCLRRQQGALDEFGPPRLEVGERRDHGPRRRRHGRVDLVDDPGRVGHVVERLRRVRESGTYAVGWGSGIVASVGYDVDCEAERFDDRRGDRDSGRLAR